MFVGLVISIIQKLLPFRNRPYLVPKIVAIFLTIILLGSWMIRFLLIILIIFFMLIEKIGVG
jgi:flagellar biosynthesis protein FliQ